MTNRFGKLLYLLLSLSTMQQLHAQEKAQYQVTVLSENDNYTLRRIDRYYTNGLMIRFSKGWNSEHYKKIFFAEGGQLIFNPYKQNINFETTMDRPFTGFLYLKGGLTQIDAKGNVFKGSLLGGVIGDDAKGKEVQRWHHKNFGLPYPYGWETQLKSEPGANVQATYYKHLTSNDEKLFNAHVKGGLNAGSFFTNVNAGAQFRLGLLNKNSESVWWDARSGTGDKKAYELFVYVEPTVTYQVYNATVQGGLFTKKQDQFTTSIKPFLYSHSFGFMYAQHHFMGGLGFTYKTKEATTMMANEKYGSILLGYRF